MPWKKDATGKIVLGGAGAPIMDENGQDVEFDDAKLDGLFSALAKANREAAERKRKLREMEDRFSGLNDVEDVPAWVAEAKNALETARSVKDKKLMDAGETEKVIARLKADLNKQLAEKETELSRIKTQFERGQIAQAFAASNVLKKTILPPDIAEAHFGRNFKVEDGRIVGKVGDDTIYTPGTVDPADFDTALEVIINKYPMKDSIMRGSSPGSGTPPNGNQPPTSGKTITRDAFEAMSHPARKGFFDSGGTVVDDA
jgi:uncharacterized coiled-coil protein SlyX